MKSKKFELPFIAIILLSTINCNTNLNFSLFTFHLSYAKVEKMKVNPETYEGLISPAYVLEEKRLRRNLALIRDVAERSGAEIILAFKAYALWKTFPIFREYISSTTASSLSEARLAYEEFGVPAHTFSPAYTESY